MKCVASFTSISGYDMPPPHEIITKDGWMPSTLRLFACSKQQLLVAIQTWVEGRMIGSNFLIYKI
jgi:hypothetical protein